MAVVNDKSAKAPTSHISLQLGFTLMEMMVVIAIIAIGAAIAIPAFMSMLPGMRLNGAARQVMGDLMAARMNAVKENNNYRVFFNTPAANQYQILDDNNNNGSADANELLITKYIQTEGNSDTPKYYDVAIVSASNNPEFTPRGTIKGVTNAIITVTNSSKYKQVKVAVTGRVKIQDYEPES